MHALEENQKKVACKGHAHSYGSWTGCTYTAGMDSSRRPCMLRLVRAEKRAGACAYTKCSGVWGGGEMDNPTWLHGPRTLWSCVGWGGEGAAGGAPHVIVTCTIAWPRARGSRGCASRHEGAHTRAPRLLITAPSRDITLRTARMAAVSAVGATAGMPGRKRMHARVLRAPHSARRHHLSQAPSLASGISTTTISAIATISTTTISRP